MSDEMSPLFKFHKLRDSFESASLTTGEFNEP